VALSAQSDELCHGLVSHMMVVILSESDSESAPQLLWDMQTEQFAV
jgi:hypothetical protein